ncbi:MAG: hypothetical protein QOJ81_1412 [Chloroflexota bacterium]|jgi:hypothetical protein|nr:hypothetical protein [Chloroflexota bacterium]
MKRLIWLPIAGFLLIAGAAVAAAAPALVDEARGLLDPGAADSGSITVTASTDAHPGQQLLTDVLADLVSNGTITQTQSDAITQALQDRVDQQQAEMEAHRALVEGFIADGVITQDEIDQLPADDPLRVGFDSIANDGQITLDQLRGLGPFGGHGFGPGGHGHGGGMFWIGDGPDDSDGSDASASPSPSASSTNS